MVIPFDQIKPAMITAPTARNGITLLQRLLNSSRQMIVYGENKHLCELLPQMVHLAHGVHVQNGPGIEKTRNRFLNETTEFWSSGLWPDTKMYLDLSVETFCRYIRLYQTCSERYGFKRWGIKHPFTNVAIFDRFYSLLPHGRFIYIYRNLFDVARSSKARKFIKTPADFGNLAQTWQESVRVVRGTRADNLLVIKYEELLEQPQEWIARIESFIGITNIDPEVMKTKYNTFREPAEGGYSATEYIPPESLSQEEVAILRAVAADALAAEGYSDQGVPEPALSPA
jgi:hypothetical protein